MSDLTGVFTGVGVGPGDPLLITLKAVQAIQAADIVCYLANVTGESQAKTIAREALAQVTREQEHLPIVMPMSENRQIANAIYDKTANTIGQALQSGQRVVFLCEGDPLFFGSFAYLLERLQGDYSCQVIPGISSVNAAASALLQPLTLLRESFAVVSGRHSEQQLLAVLQVHDSVVIMKAGRARPKILAALQAADRLADAQYLENIGRQNQRILTDVEHLESVPGPYFSLFMVTRSQRGTR